MSDPDFDAITKKVLDDLFESTTDALYPPKPPTLGDLFYKRFMKVDHHE